MVLYLNKYAFEAIRYVANAETLYCEHCVALCSDSGLHSWKPEEKMSLPVVMSHMRKPEHQSVWLIDFLSEPHHQVLFPQVNKNEKAHF